MCVLDFDRKGISILGKQQEFVTLKRFWGFIILLLLCADAQSSGQKFCADLQAAEYEEYAIRWEGREYYSYAMDKTESLRVTNVLK